MAYLNALSRNMKEFNMLYGRVNKVFPSKSRLEKMLIIVEKYNEFTKEKGIESKTSTTSARSIMMACVDEVMGYNEHYYIEDGKLFDFFRNAEFPKFDTVRRALYELISRKSLSKIGDDGEDYFNRLKTLHELTNSNAVIGETYVNAIARKENETLEFTISLHGEKEAHTFVGVVYTKNDEVYLSIVCVDVETVSRWSYCLSMDDTRCNLTSVENDGSDMYESFIRFKLFINFILYMSAFPECIHDRLPKSVSARKNKGSTITTSSHIRNDESERLGLTFFRSGCFVTFSSPRYKGARGKTVWRKSTVVNRNGNNIKTVTE